MYPAVNRCRSCSKFHLYIVYLGFLIPNATRANGFQLLLFAPIATHVDKLRVFMEQLRQLFHIFL